MVAGQFRRRYASLAVGAAMATTATAALGAGFALQEQNASGLGHAYAGGAAAAEDVSTIFYNPAGLVRLQSMQVVAAANVICPSAKFRDGGSQPAALQPLGGTGGDAGDCAVVPNLYLGVPFTDAAQVDVAVPAGHEAVRDGRARALNLRDEAEGDLLQQRQPRLRRDLRRDQHDVADDHDDEQERAAAALQLEQRHDSGAGFLRAEPVEARTWQRSSPFDRLRANGESSQSRSSEAG